MLLAGPAGASLPSAQPLSTYVEARTADALGDQGRAARLYASLLRGDPGNRNLAARAISASIDSGDMRLAISVARSLPRSELKLDTRLLLIGDALRRDKPDEALSLLAGVDGDPDGAFVTPLIRAWTVRDGAAILASLPGDAVIAAFAAEQQASILLARGRADEALALIPKALAGAGGRETRLRLNFAALLARAGKKEQAQALLSGSDPALARLDINRPQRGIAVDSAADGFAEMLLGLAVGLARGEERALPLTLVQIARHTSPDNSEASILAALLLGQTGRSADALSVLDSIPADDPFAEDVLDATARLLLETGRGPEALGRAKAAVARPGPTAGALARLGNVLDDLDRHGEAAEAYGRAAAIADAANADNRWSFRLLRAAQLDQLDRWPEARAELKAGLAVAPNHPLLLNYLGYGSLERGENLDEAEAMIRRALAMRPGDSSITDSLGWALYKRGRLAEAISTLRSAAASEPAEAEIHEHLGDALYRAGRRYEARFAWRAALVTADAAEAKRIEAKISSGWTPSTAAP